MITFQELQPENNGKIESQNITLDRWSWNQNLSNNLMAENVHYVLQGTVPKGLTLEIETLNEKTAQLTFKGIAENHHVSQSTKELVLTWLPSAFLANSAKALEEEIESYALHIQFGVGFTIGGEIIESPSSVNIELIQGSEVIQEVAAGQSFQFEYQLEHGETFEVMVKNHPENTCCKVKNGYGTINNKDVDAITIDCSTPTWEDPESDEEALAKPFEIGGISNTITIVPNPSSDSLELIAIENGTMLTHSTYKLQHGVLKRPDDIELIDPRVLFATDNPNAYVSQFQYAINNDGHIIALISVTENNSIKLFTARYKNYFSETLQEPTLLTQVPLNSRGRKVFSYDNNWGLITYEDTNLNNVLYTHFNGESWTPIQTFGLDSDAHGLAEYDGDVNASGSGAFVLKYFSTNISTSLYQIYKVDFNFNNFTAPLRINVGMYTVNNQGDIANYNSNCIAWLEACNCQNNVANPEPGPITPVCYEQEPIPQNQLLWNYDSTTLNSVEASVSESGDADIFWYQRTTPSSNNHYLMHAAKTNLFWDRPFNLDDAKQIVNRPNRLDSEKDGNHLVLVQHTDSTSSGSDGYTRLILAIKNNGEWIYDGQNYLKYEPFSDELSENSSNFYEKEPLNSHITFNDNMFNVRASISQAAYGYKLYNRSFDLATNSDIVGQTVYDSQDDEKFISSSMSNFHIFGANLELDTNKTNFFRKNIDNANSLEIFSDNTKSLSIKKTFRAPSCPGIFLLWNKTAPDFTSEDFVSRYF